MYRQRPFDPSLGSSRAQSKINSVARVRLTESNRIPNNSTLAAGPLGGSNREPEPAEGKADVSMNLTCLPLTDPDASGEKPGASTNLRESQHVVWDGYSISSFRSQDSRNGHQQNFEIKRETATLDIVDIQLHLLRKREIAATGNLPEAR